MTPLEAMTAAHWDVQVDEHNKWSELSQDEKDEAMAPMRAALLALAEAELPVQADGGDATVRALFRAMLRAVIDHGAANDPQDIPASGQSRV